MRTSFCRVLWVSHPSQLPRGLSINSLLGCFRFIANLQLYSELASCLDVAKEERQRERARLAHPVLGFSSQWAESTDI